MPSYQHPGVYIEEVSTLPPSVAEVASSVAAFVGYTVQTLQPDGADLRLKPTRITSLQDYEARFGGAGALLVDAVDLDAQAAIVGVGVATGAGLHDSLRLFFTNGGGIAHVVSVGLCAASGPTAVDADALKAGLDSAAALDEPSLLLCPDAARLSAADVGAVQQHALAQCARQHCFALLDTRSDDPLAAAFRAEIGSADLKHGAAYTPWLNANHGRVVRHADIAGRVRQGGAWIALQSLTTDGVARDLLDRLDAASTATPPTDTGALEDQLRARFPLYRSILDAVGAAPIALPPSGAVAGVCAQVDAQRGVWKAPANVALTGITGLTATLTDQDSDALTTDTAAGKSVNAIRAFAGKGILVWGARTLAGNENEWRYVPVRRFFDMVEASLTRASESFVFEANDANTWARLRAMFENYLLLKWRQGALAGGKPEEAFYVRCGLDLTMTALDILEGRLIAEIGLAPARPAEFIVVRVTQRVQND